MHQLKFATSDFFHDRLEHETIYTINPFMSLHFKLLIYRELDLRQNN